MNVLAAQLVVIAKDPVPGRVKTRLTPPFTPREAARLAAAALDDTLDAVGRTPAARRILALDGKSAPWLPHGFEVIAQRGTGLDQRLAAAFSDGYASMPLPVVLIGMDTPQVTPELLAAALRPLATGAADAAFGPADDGGFWLLGLRRPRPGLIEGVPMSAADTGRTQLLRLERAGLRTRMLPTLTDVDTAADAMRVARQAPDGRFTATLRMTLGATAQETGANTA